MMSDDTVTLWRPVGPAKLYLIVGAEINAFPPRLPEQPIYYPVTTEDYAMKIARDWNVPAYLDRFAVQNAGGSAHQEYWIPAEDLDAFNAAIVGSI